MRYNKTIDHQTGSTENQGIRLSMVRFFSVLGLSWFAVVAWMVLCPFALEALKVRHHEGIRVTVAVTVCLVLLISAVAPIMAFRAAGAIGLRRSVFALLLAIACISSSLLLLAVMVWSALAV